MGRLLPLLVPLGLVATACGGAKQVTTSTSAPDPGKVAVRALLRAASRDDGTGLWNLLSKPSQQRLGPTLSLFRSLSARDVERTLKPFEGTSPAPFISQSVSQQFGVVAIRSGAHAFAFPLRHENGAWKVEWAGPVRFQILGPQPGSHGTVAQVAVEVRSSGVLGDAVVFVDGTAVRPNLTPTPKTATVFANLQRALPAGVHTAVIYAEEGRDAGAQAWTFTATKPS